MGTIKRLFEQVFGVEPSLGEVVDQLFPKNDRNFARAFYKPWSHSKFLLVQVGDGYDQLSREKFFASAWFYFIWPPIAEREWAIVGTHAEDELGAIIVRKHSGNICYKYDETFVDLAESFPDFIRSLRAAGWIEE
jgi:hypothetical protein